MKTVKLSQQQKAYIKTLDNKKQRKAQKRYFEIVNVCGELYGVPTNDIEVEYKRVAVTFVDVLKEITEPKVDIPQIEKSSSLEEELRESLNSELISQRIVNKIISIINKHKAK